MKITSDSAKSVRKGAGRRTIGAAAFVLALFLIFGMLPVSATGGEENIHARKIELYAPDILTGESMVQIGDTKYIRYSITLDEYKTLIYSEIGFEIEFDASLLTLYATNITLSKPQIYAYDTPVTASPQSQRNIIYYEPVLDGGSVSCGAYSTTGMWFSGPVIILYFLPVDEGYIGNESEVRLTNFSIKLLEADGTPADMSEYTVGTRDGKITVTGERDFISGDTMSPDDTSPIPGKGYGSTETTASEGFVFTDNPNAPLYITIAVIIILFAAAVFYFGIGLVVRILKFETKRKPPDAARADGGTDDGKPGGRSDSENNVGKDGESAGGNNGKSDGGINNSPG